MIRILFFITSLVFAAHIPGALVQVKDFAPVTQEMLLHPPPGDWLMKNKILIMPVLLLPGILR